MQQILSAYCKSSLCWHINSGTMWHVTDRLNCKLDVSHIFVSSVVRNALLLLPCQKCTLHFIVKPNNPIKLSACLCPCVTYKTVRLNIFLKADFSLCYDFSLKGLLCPGQSLNHCESKCFSWLSWFSLARIPPVECRCAQVSD